MKFSEVLLVTDMDGTLLNSEKLISEENRLAITNFIAEGGQFSIATGRTPLSAKRWLDTLAINAPCVFYNGSLVMDYSNKEILSSYNIEKKHSIEFIKKIIKEYPDVIVEIYTNDKIAIVSDKGYKNLEFNNEGDTYHKCSLDSVLDDEWYKILFCCYDSSLMKVAELFEKANLKDYFNAFFSYEYYYEITPYQTSKGAAITTFKNDRFVVAVGDQENDIDMIVKANCGIAVDNAISNLKDVADLISVSNDEHVIAEIIEMIKVLNI